MDNTATLWKPDDPGELIVQATKLLDRAQETGVLEETAYCGCLQQVTFEELLTTARTKGARGVIATVEGLKSLHDRPHRKPNNAALKKKRKADNDRPHWKLVPWGPKTFWIRVNETFRNPNWDVWMPDPPPEFPDPKRRVRYATYGEVSHVRLAEGFSHYRWDYSRRGDFYIAFYIARDLHHWLQTVPPQLYQPWTDDQPMRWQDLIIYADHLQQHGHPAGEQIILWMNAVGLLKE